VNPAGSNSIGLTRCPPSRSTSASTSGSSSSITRRHLAAITCGRRNWLTPGRCQPSHRSSASPTGSAGSRSSTVTSCSSPASNRAAAKPVKPAPSTTIRANSSSLLSSLGSSHRDSARRHQVGFCRHFRVTIPGAADARGRLPRFRGIPADFPHEHRPLAHVDGCSRSHARDFARDSPTIRLTRRARARGGGTTAMINAWRFTDQMGAMILLAALVQSTYESTTRSTI
jgi:hypothetical protein